MYKYAYNRGVATVPFRGRKNARGVEVFRFGVKKAGRGRRIIYIFIYIYVYIYNAYIYIHCAAIPDPSPFPFRSLQCGPSALIALWSLGIYATALAARLSTTAAKSAHAFTGVNTSRSALGGSSTASLPRKSNFRRLRSCASTNSSMHDGLFVPLMRRFLAQPRRQLSGRRMWDVP